MPEIVTGLDESQLLNMLTGKILDLATLAKSAGLFDAIREYPVSGKGMAARNLGKVLVPESKQYSWAKAADILGMVQENLIPIEGTDNYWMDIKARNRDIDRLSGAHVPVLAVVAVFGTTEVEAVDKIHEIVRLRDRC
jgi:glutamate/tyrosine decarboxylase-like PLP-dependent enzyme